MTEQLSTVADTKENDYSDSVMICLRPDPDQRDVFASMKVATVEADELHITLAYLGSTEDLGGEPGRERLFRACYGLALEDTPEIKGKVNGFGWFLNDDSHVLVALWDLPYLGSLREQLLAQCVLHGVPLRTEDHGFTPHMTLSHQDETDYTIPEVPLGGGQEVVFPSLWMVWGEDWQEIALT